MRAIVLSLAMAAAAAPAHAQATKPAAPSPADKAAAAKLAAFEKAFKLNKDDDSLEPRRAALAAIAGMDDARTSKALLVARAQVAEEAEMAVSMVREATAAFVAATAKAGVTPGAKKRSAAEQAKLDKAVAAAKEEMADCSAVYFAYVKLLGELDEALVGQRSAGSVAFLLANLKPEHALPATTLARLAKNAARAEPPQVDALMGALARVEGSDARVALLDGVAACGRAAAGQAKLLADLLWNKDEAVAVAALWALGACGSPDAIAPLVHRLGEEKSLLAMRRASLALRWLTDADHGWEVRAWRTWLAADGAKLADGSAPLPERAPVDCFGLPLYAQSVAFVVDCSEAMLAKWPKQDSAETRLDAAKRELLATIAALPADARFTVVAFAHEARALGPTLQAATPEQKAAAAEWIGKVSTAPKTVAAVSEGLAKALEVAAASEEAPGRAAKLDAVVLIAAGRPARPDGKPEPADIVKKVVEIGNKPVHALIEAIAFADPAARQRGEFRWLEELVFEHAGRMAWK